MLKIGSHVSMSGKKMLLGAAEEAYSYGSSAFMIYTGAPQNTRRKSIEEMNIVEGKAFMAEHGLVELVVHAPYIINLGNTTKSDHFEFAIDFLRNEIIRAQALGAKQITLHPGSHVGAGADKGISQIIKGLNEVLEPNQTAQIALETMAGKGTEIGRSFDEIARIIDGVTHNDRLSVTFDTCHVHDAGYDIVGDLDGVLTEFDKTIGLNRIQVLHINDSKNERGAGKDRHENIGFGHIGFDALASIVHLKEFAEIPKILETPYVGEDKLTKKAPYEVEIDMLSKQFFEPERIEALR